MYHQHTSGQFSQTISLIISGFSLHKYATSSRCSDSVSPTTILSSSDNRYIFVVFGTEINSPFCTKFDCLISISTTSHQLCPLTNLDTNSYASYNLHVFWN